MKAVQFSGVITSIRSKVDKSLGLSISTPELSVNEKAEFMSYQGVNSEFFLKPLDEVPDEEMVVSADLDGKTPSQRLRAVDYVLWTKMKEAGEYVPENFQEFYNKDLESLIEKRKERIEEYE